MSESESSKHIEELTDPQYHKNGGCVIRHASARNAECKYEENGYRITLAARSAWYNAPTRFRLEDRDWTRLTPRDRKIAKKLVKSFVTPAPSGRIDPTLWNIGLHGNFVPGGGFHIPYLHNWHHMIASELVFKLLYDEDYGVKLLQVLMSAPYNLNGELNIVLLPQEKKVGEVIQWPIHPNNHPTFDAYVSEKLLDLKRRLKQALGTPEKHPVEAKNVGNVATDLNSVSSNLLRLLEQMGRENAGEHINRVKQYGAAIEAKLGLTSPLSGA